MKMNTHLPFNSSGDTLDGFKFTFDFYLDDKARIEADPNPTSDDFDSGDTASLTESICEFHRENGRTYHAYRAGSYYFPNDQDELDRLDNQHEILKILLDGRNYLAPFSQSNPPRKVLDIATGTGRWAIEMGDEFPQSRIIGTDLSPTQPREVPPNVQFYVDDATEEWQSGSEWHNLDYVHTRMSVGCWNDMPAQLIRMAYQRLRPGGYLECQEPYCDVEVDGEPALDGSTHSVKWWMDELASASAAAQRPLGTAANLKRWFIEAGFVDVQEKVYKIPINSWPRISNLKRIGEMWHRNLEGGLSGLSYGLFHRIRGMSREEIEVSLVNVRKDLADKHVQAYQRFCIVWGRKPENLSEPVAHVDTPPRVSKDEAMTGCS